MKLGYVSQFLTQDYKGPVTNLLAELSKEVDVHNFSSLMKSIQYFRRGETFEAVNEDVSKSFHVHRYKVRLAARGLLFPKDLRDLMKVERLDVIQSEEFYQPASWVSSRFAREKEIPFIINVRRNHVRGIKERAFFSLTNKYSRRAVKNADRIIVITEAGRKFLLRNFPGVHTDKIELVPNSIDPKQYSRAKAEKFFSEHDIPNDRPTVLSVARVQRSKRIDLLLKAFSRTKRRVPEAQLVVVGPWNDDERERMDGIIKKRGISDVHFTGGIPNKDVKHAFAAADVFALTSEWEPFGYVLLEAMCLKKPVVSFSIGGVPEIIDNGETGYCVRFGDTKGMSKRIVELLSDTERARALGVAGRESIDSRFSLEKNAKKMLNIYRELL